MSQLIDFGFNFLLSIILFSAVLLLFQYFHRYKEKRRLFKMVKIKWKKEEKKTTFQLQYTKKLRQKINLYFTFKQNKKLKTPLYASILIIELSLFLLFIIYKEIFLAVAFPLLFHVFILKLLDIVTVNMNQIIANNFSKALRHVTKVLAKTSDLKVVLYETGKDLDEPLRSMFLDLSRKMVSGNQEDTLLEFADEVDNVWVYAFVFILMNYKEQSRKEDVENNLLVLADILDKEKHIKEQAITDKKFITVMNYALCFLAVVGFVLNLIFNDEAFSFFFNSTTGLISLIVGFVTLFATILINLKMSH